MNATCLNLEQPGVIYSRLTLTRMTEEEFAQIYNQYSDDIFRFCLFKLRDRDLALDLMQQTFVKTWRALQKGKEIEQIKPFLYRVARNLIIDYSRKKKSQSLDAMMEAGFDPGEDDHPQLQARLDAQAKLQVLKKLEPKSYQELILLRYVEDLSLKDISKVLKISEKNVSVRLTRAMKKLRNLLEA